MRLFRELEHMHLFIFMLDASPNFIMNVAESSIQHISVRRHLNRDEIVVKGVEVELRILVTVGGQLILLGMRLSVFATIISM